MVACYIYVGRADRKNNLGEVRVVCQISLWGDGDLARCKIKEE